MSERTRAPRRHEPCCDAGTRTILLLHSTYIVSVILLRQVPELYWNLRSGCPLAGIYRNYVLVGKEVLELCSGPFLHNFITSSYRFEDELNL